MRGPWTELGGVDPRSLTAVRRELHHAAWLLGSVAESLLPAAADWSHANLGFGAESGAFATRALDLESGLALELEATEASLHLRKGGATRERWPLAGRSLDELRAWGAGFVEERGAAFTPRALPEDGGPIAEGAAFSAPAAEHTELARWFAVAQQALAALSAGELDGAEPRTWPHHFDTGLLHELDAERGIGAGFSPGDAVHAQPYFYVYAYPTPEELEPAALDAPAGSWTTEGFRGWQLLGCDLLGEADRGGAVRAFLKEAAQRCRALLGRG